MKPSSIADGLTVFALNHAAVAADPQHPASETAKTDAGQCTAHSNGFHADRPPKSTEFSTGTRFHTTILPVMDRPTIVPTKSLERGKEGAVAPIHGNAPSLKRFAGGASSGSRRHSAQREGNGIRPDCHWPASKIDVQKPAA